ncbi:alcohol dehydrogenase [Terasakiella brassicae]|uniref:Alcohol dehydrogenase n=1 Tax=Terasakiella brassicae TaxID=1634917 RepID=A0A917BNA1_9PROT|nr:MDR family oxidoreductase [Terasakiella brassicae]GGF52793.1 alcohol dehydrogenase [Terasakiella brassicae]
MFKSLLLSQSNDKVSAQITEMDESKLPEGDVLVKVDYSTLNYKDGLVLNGLGGLVRNYPHIGGIDFAGTVESSDHKDFKPGDKVVLTGWRVGEAHWGGYSQKARVNGDWLVPLPEGLTPRQAMAVGTAGFTAMLGVMALEDHGLTPDQGEVLVTGAAGGVGSVAAAILAKLGYSVAGSTGRADTHDYLRDMGVTTIIDRSELNEPSKRPLEKERWAGCIDAVGGTTLARALAQMQYGASVAAIGLAGGNKLDTTVIPFLLRGVNLLGIDSVMCPTAKRLRAWQRIATDLPMEKLENMTSEAKLQDLPQLGKDILAGNVRGRVVVDIAGS